jgi:long-chain acyl-CoA synthetase
VAQRQTEPSDHAPALERIRGAPNLGAAFRARLEAGAHATACLEPADGDFVAVDTATFGEEVDAIARAMLAAGLDAGDRVALMGPNGRWWAAADLAALSLGLVVVPLYQGQQPAELRYIIEDAAPALICIRGAKAVDELQATFREAGYTPPVAVAEPGDRPLADPMREWQAFLDGGAAVSPEAVATANTGVARDHLATLVYTSGTTGWPKGVELTHDNLLTNLEGILSVLAIEQGDRFLSFLPVAHIFERTTGHLLAYLAGCEVAYARGTQTVAADLGAARPTILVAVPRLYQVFHDRAQAQRDRSRATDLLLRWATGDGGRPPRLRGALARRLLARRFRQRMGGRIRLLVSGGAALPPAVAAFFRDIGLPILEGYGQTETAPVVACNRPGSVHIGTVGQPLPNLEVRLGPEDEVQVRGPNVMRGYWNRAEETAAVFDGEWLRTGDVGEIDDDGYLRITDRLKELLVTSGGKNIPPQRIELRLAAQPVIQQAVIFGDRQPFLGALLVPDWETLWQRLDRDPQSPPDPDDREANRLVRETMHKALADLPAWEQVRRFRLLTEPLTQERGELTPTLKVKRKVVANHYADAIEDLFAEA